MRCPHHVGGSHGSTDWELYTLTSPRAPGSTAWGLSLSWVCPFLIYLWWVLTFDSSSAFSKNSGSWQGAWLRHHSSSFRVSKTEECPPNRVYTYSDFFKEDMCTVRVDFRENSNHSILPVGRSEGTWSCVLWEKSWGVCYVAETQGVFEIAAREQQQISWHPCPASSTHSLPGLCALEEGLKKVKMSVIQSCLTLCDPMDCSLPAPLSMGFPRQEYWSGLPFLLRGIFPTRLLHCRQILYHWATWEAPHSVEQRAKCAMIPLGPFAEGSIFWLSLVNQNTVFAVLSSVCSSQNRKLK